MDATRPATFNETGDFEYADTMEYEGGFVMTGTIRVVDQGITTMNPATFDTVGALMVLRWTFQNMASFKNAGFGIDRMHIFKDSRG